MSIPYKTAQLLPGSNMTASHLRLLELNARWPKVSAWTFSMTVVADVRKDVGVSRGMLKGCQEIHWTQSLLIPQTEYVHFMQLITRKGSFDNLIWHKQICFYLCMHAHILIWIAFFFPSIHLPFSPHVTLSLGHYPYCGLWHWADKDSLYFDFSSEILKVMKYWKNHESGMMHHVCVWSFASPAKCWSMTGLCQVFKFQAWVCGFFLCFVGVFLGGRGGGGEGGGLIVEGFLLVFRDLPCFISKWLESTNS